MVADVEDTGFTVVVDAAGAVAMVEAGAVVGVVDTGDDRMVLIMVPAIMADQVLALVFKTTETY
jgi:hypothetical protein